MTNVGTILQQKYAFYSKIRGYYSASMMILTLNGVKETYNLM